MHCENEAVCYKIMYSNHGSCNLKFFKLLVCDIRKLKKTESVILVVGLDIVRVIKDEPLDHSLDLLTSVGKIQ